MARRSNGQTALALLLSLLGVGACFLTWDRTSLLGLTDADDGFERWHGLAAAGLFTGCAACILLSRRREASAWWAALGYFLLPLATICVTGVYAWGYLPAGVRARLGSGTRMGAAFREFGGAFKWSEIGVGAYAAFALAVGLLLIGLTRARCRQRD